MTEVTAPRPNSRVHEQLPSIHYQVAMPQPETHLFEVTLQVVDYPSPIVDLKLPVWTPGSYLVREYAKNLQDFAAFANDQPLRWWKNFAAFANDQPLRWWKKSKNHWQVDKSNVAKLTIKYRVFANELSVRTNHLDVTHGYFNGAALFFKLPGWEKQPIRITIVPPYPQWRVTTALPVDSEAANTFYAADFDTLVDSPFEMN